MTETLNYRQNIIVIFLEGDIVLEDVFAIV